LSGSEFEASLYMTCSSTSSKYAVQYAATAAELVGTSEALGQQFTEMHGFANTAFSPLHCVKISY